MTLHLLPAVPTPEIVWFAVVAGGFLLGSVPFCWLLPRVLLGKDICQLSKDGNPGAANVFVNCGVLMGAVCLTLDILKGFLPVFAAARFFNVDDFRFALAMAAPVAGHAVGIFRGFRGGKGIAASFGSLAGLIPESFMMFMLAGIYIIFSTLLKINPNRRRSVVTYLVFAAVSCGVMSFYGRFAMAAGCLLISGTVIFKHVFSGEAASEKASASVGVLKSGISSGKALMRAGEAVLSGEASGKENSVSAKRASRDGETSGVGKQVGVERVSGDRIAPNGCIVTEGEPAEASAKSPAESRDN